ncbi:hypothetical protein G7Z17_g11178 [Cylindrodendrum hubeiense]|uniref:Uncharacterized protein n=1 Tax=Cylindrodendrum hubeiense TaxID=595255 RepID=A0A9P5H1H9_9HYPO|nr:hypothetical protein G7Z17_g11178 [Cylindrodendrum hubeiense]
MPLRRPSTSDGQSVLSSSPSPSLGTKRRFPLLGRKKNRNSELIRPSTGLSLSLSSLSSSSKAPSKVKKPGLRVHIQVKFEGSHSSEHTRDYEASSQLIASDRLCQALLARLQHCSAELITRHDCSALDPLRKPHRDVKPLRYRITYRVEREGLTLVEKSLRSFQEYPPTADDQREVVSATDRIVGLFLVRHDPGFRWLESPDTEPVNFESETVRPSTGRPQAISCVPRSRFIHNTQAFELVPGYTIELFLRSRCATRYPENRNASIKIDSRQPTPLTLLLGEELTTRVSNLVIDPIDSYKRKFDKRHRSCNGFEGSGGCQHVEDGAVDIMVKVRNNLGPDYNYFSQRIQTSKVLFNDPNGRDFDEFANSVKAKLEKARDMSDKSVRSMDDLTLRIRELRGKNWSVHEPLTIRLDPSVTYCRQTVEAIMERLQAGISNVLEGHEDALAIMTAHKRGHLIYDGFLDGAGGDDYNTPPEKYASPDLERRALEAKLKERIRADITMLCKDTCALDCTDALPNLKLRASGASAGPKANEAPRDNNALREVRPSSGRSHSESVGSGRSDHTLSKKQAKPNLRDPSQREPSLAPSSIAPSSLAPSSPTSLAPAELQRVPSGVEMAKKYGYMADFIADDENQSEPPSTPSLVDTDSISPRDSIVATPQSSRAMPQDQSNEGLRIIDDGRRIIYEEQSDADAIARGVTEFHRYPEDEPIQLIKDRLPETPERRATRRSLDTRMPDLSGNLDSVIHHAVMSAPVQTPKKEEKLKEPAVIQAAKIIQPEEPVAPVPIKETKPEEPVVEQADVPVVTEPVKAEITPETAFESSKSDETVPKEVASKDTVAPNAAEKSVTSHDEQWEMVEATDAPQPQLPAATLVPEEVEANSKSETSVGTSTSTPSIREEVEPTEKPTPAIEEVSKEFQEKTIEPTTTEEATLQETVEQQPKEALAEVQVEVQPEVQQSIEVEKQVSEAVKATSEVAPAVNIEREVSPESDVAEESKENIALDDFPEPPHVHNSHPESKTEEVTPEVEKPKEEQPLVQEHQEQPETTLQVEETTQPETVRSSSDSGISMEEQPREEEPKEEEPKDEVIKEEESKSEQSKEELPKAEVPEEKEPEAVESQPTVPEGSDIPTEEQSKSVITEEMEQESTAILSRLSSPMHSPMLSPMLEPVPEEDVSEDEAVSGSYFPLTRGTPALPPPHSAPMEKLLTHEDRFRIISAFDELPEPPRFERANLPPVLTRPRTNTLPERRYSTALTLDSVPFHSPGNSSPVDPPPKSAMFGRQASGNHRRQPSAGWIGLREQRMHEVGLRNALVPYRWRARNLDGSSRPSTSYSEQ